MVVSVYEKISESESVIFVGTGVRRVGADVVVLNAYGAESIESKWMVEPSLAGRISMVISESVFAVTMKEGNDRINLPSSANCEHLLYRKCSGME